MGPPSRVVRNYGFLIYRLLHTSLARHLYKTVVYHLVGYARARARRSFSFARSFSLSLFASSKCRGAIFRVVLAHPVLSRTPWRRPGLTFLSLSLFSFTSSPRLSVNDERAAITVTLTIAESSGYLSPVRFKEILDATLQKERKMVHLSVSRLDYSRANFSLYQPLFLAYHELSSHSKAVFH